LTPYGAVYSSVIADRTTDVPPNIAAQFCPQLRQSARTRNALAAFAAILRDRIAHLRFANNLSGPFVDVLLVLFEPDPNLHETSCLT
jgi:hypothetical protein